MNSARDGRRFNVSGTSKPAAQMAATLPRGWLGKSTVEGIMMDSHAMIKYSKPTIQSFGTFREVTRAGTEWGFGDTSGGIWRFLLTNPQSS